MTMKKKLILPLLAIAFTSPAMASMIYIDKSKTDEYDSYVRYSGSIVNVSESACKSNGDYCWRHDGRCDQPMDNSYSAETCENYCERREYSAYVIDYSSNEWGCGCATKRDPGWQPYKTGVLRYYSLKLSAKTRCEIPDQATDTCKCEAGYYRSSSTTSCSSIQCTICPTNATCTNGITFNCTNGYYRNGTVCTKCPDSKTGGLGWDTNGNGIAAVGGNESITYCAIAPGTVLRDTTGTFKIDEEESADGCEYSE